MPRDRENWLKWKREEYRRKREKILAQRKEAYRQNPEKYLAANRKRKRQGGNGEPPHEGECTICGKWKMLYYDHDHATGAFRDWICGHCNAGLGHFGDDPEVLRAAAFYVLWSRRGPRQLMKVS